MVVAQAKLTRKYQITIPSEVRRELNLNAGDLVYLAVEDGQAILRGLLGSWTESYHGLGAELWRQEGGWQAIEREREAWDEE